MANGAIQLSETSTERRSSCIFAFELSNRPGPCHDDITADENLGTDARAFSHISGLRAADVKLLLWKTGSVPDKLSEVPLLKDAHDVSCKTIPSPS